MRYVWNVFWGKPTIINKSKLGFIQGLRFVDLHQTNTEPEREQWSKNRVGVSENQRSKARLCKPNKHFFKPRKPSEGTTKQMIWYFVNGTSLWLWLRDRPLWQLILVVQTLRIANPKNYEFLKSSFSRITNSAVPLPCYNTMHGVSNWVLTTYKYNT